MTASGAGRFSNMAFVKPCKHSRGPIYFPIDKLGQKNSFKDILDELENGSGLLKTMAASGRALYIILI